MSTAPPLAYLAPTATWFGPQTADAVHEGLKIFGGLTAGTVLVAVDRILVEVGAVDGMLEGLRGGGFEPLILSDFGPELLDTQVDAAAEAYREHGAVAVVGVGGGSVLDAAKMIALLGTNEGAAADWFGVTQPPLPRCPMVLVPTTVGTGAEVTRISMITSGGEKQIASSVAFVPDLAVLDEALVTSLPAPVVASTAADALAHATEALLSRNSNPLTEAASVQAMELVVGELRAAVEGDTAARGALLRAAYFAGLSLNAGVVLGHSLGYAINHEKPLPHGVTTGLSLPYTIAYNQAVEPRKAELIASVLTSGRSTSLRDAAQAVVELLESVRLPMSLDAVGIPEGVEDEMARRTVDLYPRPTNPEPMDIPRVRALIGAMRTGDLDAAFASTAQKEN